MKHKKEFFLAEVMIFCDFSHVSFSILFNLSLDRTDIFDGFLSDDHRLIFFHSTRSTDNV